jgi:hypothetical protein
MIATVLQTALRELMGKTLYDIKFRTGLSANINAKTTRGLARQGMPHYAVDTGKTYVFDGDNNMRVHGLDMALVFEGEVITFNNEIIWLE